MAEIYFSGNQIGLARHAKAIAFNDRNLPGADKFVHLLGKLAAILGIEAPLFGDGFGSGGQVAAAFKMGEKTVLGQLACLL